MATRRVLARFSLFCAAAVLLASESSLVEGLETHGAAGVFMFSEGGRYTLNFTAAKAACRMLNVTIATRAQLEEALRRGLETCKFGWIHEKLVVVPRIKSEQNCGKGRTGLVLWFVNEGKEFAVYCFNASEGTAEASTVQPRTSTRALRPRSAPTTSTYPTSEPAEQTSRTSAFDLRVTAARSSGPETPVNTPSTSLRVSTSEPEGTAEASTVQSSTRALRPTSAPLTSTSTCPTSEPAEQTSRTSAFTLRVTAGSSPAETPVNTSSTSLHVSTSEPGVVTSAAQEPKLWETVFPRSVTSAARSLGALVLVLLLTAAAAALCHKRKTFRSCRSERTSDAETEMWTHAGSETALHRRPGGDEEEEEDDEEEDLDRTFSSDVQLCVGTHASDQPHGV